MGDGTSLGVRSQPPVTSDLAPAGGPLRPLASDQWLFGCSAPLQRLEKQSEPLNRATGSGSVFEVFFFLWV